MNQRPYRLRSSSAGPRSVENERLAQAVKLDRYKEFMPGKDERVSTHVVASGDIAEAIEFPWGLSSSPHFDTINKQTSPSSPPSLPLNPNLPVKASLSVAPTCSARPCRPKSSLPLVHGPSHTFVYSQPIVHDSITSPHPTALSQPESALTDVKGVEEEGEEEEELRVESPPSVTHGCGALS